MGTVNSIINIPIIPGTPDSFHNRIETKMVNNGAVHNELKYAGRKSNRFTSFDNKLTIFPGAVSPSAVCESRSA